MDRISENKCIYRKWKKNLQARDRSGSTNEIVTAPPPFPSPNVHVRNYSGSVSTASRKVPKTPRKQPLGENLHFNWNMWHRSTNSLDCKLIKRVISHSRLSAFAKVSHCYGWPVDLARCVGQTVMWLNVPGSGNWGIIHTLAYAGILLLLLSSSHQLYSHYIGK